MAKELIDRFRDVIVYKEKPRTVNKALKHVEQSKQCALICCETEYHSLRELLFNLKSCGIEISSKVYNHRLNELINEEEKVKQEIINQ
jgi:hypothetical protein